MISQGVATYRLRTLGGLAITGQDGALTPGSSVVPRRGLALLALLSVAGERGIARDKILAYLWPESEAEKARHSLNQLLYAVRRDLHSESLILGAAELRLNSEQVASDLAEFNASIACADLKRAVSAYYGPFLDGFFLSDAPEFEHWVEGERSRLATAYGRALETLAQEAVAQRDHAAGIEWWSRLAAIDPLNNRVALQVMKAMVAAGSPANALKYGENFRALLREEVATTPDAALLDFLERLRASAQSERAISPPARSIQVSAESQERATVSRELEVETRAPGQRRSASGIRNSWSFLTPRELKRRRMKIAAVGVALGLILGVSAVAILWEHVTPVQQSSRVLVPAFENLTGDAQFDALGMMTADWIVDALARSQLVDVVDAATSVTAAPATSNGPIRQPSMSAKDLAEKTGATVMVLGSCRLRAGAIEFSAIVTDVQRGKTLGRIAPVVTSQWSLPSGIAAVRQRVLSALAPILNQELRAWASGSVLPPSYESYGQYMFGLDNAWRDGASAVVHFRRAIELDSTFMSPRVALISEYLAEDEPTLADAVAVETERRRGRLSRYDGYVLDFLKAQLRGDLTAAYESSMLALETMPGSPLALRRAGYAALAANHPRRAAQLLERLDPGLGGCGDCEHYWWDLTSAEHMLGDYEQELTDAQRGVAQYPNLLPMRFNEIRALVALGRENEVEQRIDAASGLHASGWFNQLAFMNATAAELRAHGHEAAAVRIIGRALAWYAALPAEAKGIGRYDFGYALTLFLAHRWQESEVAFDRTARQHPGNTFYDGFVAAAAVHAGDDKTVQRIQAELERPEGKYGYGAAKSWLGKLAAMRGDRAGALPLLRQSFSQGREYSVYVHADPFLEALRGYAPFEELIRPQG